MGFFYWDSLRNYTFIDEMIYGCIFLGSLLKTATKIVMFHFSQKKIWLIRKTKLIKK